MTRHWSKKRNRNRIIRFNPKKTPDVISWLDAQQDRLQSVTMLIKLAQSIGGNHNWPDVVQKLARNSIIQNAFGKQTSNQHHVESYHTSANYHVKASEPKSRANHKHEDNTVDNKQISKKELKELLGE